MNFPVKRKNVSIKIKIICLKYNLILSGYIQLSHGVKIFIQKNVGVNELAIELIPVFSNITF